MGHVKFENISVGKLYKLTRNGKVLGVAECVLSSRRKKLKIDIRHQNWKKKTKLPMLRILDEDKVKKYNIKIWAGWILG